MSMAIAWRMSSGSKPAVTTGLWYSLGDKADRARLADHRWTRDPGPMKPSQAQVVP